MNYQQNDLQMMQLKLANSIIEWEWKEYALIVFFIQQYWLIK